METNPNKRFLLGFIFGGLFACFLLLLFGVKAGGELLEKLLDDSKDFEKNLIDKIRGLRSSRTTGDKFTDKFSVLPQLHTRDQEHPYRSLSSKIGDDFEHADEKFSFTRSIKHSFRKNGKTLTS